MCRGGSSPRGGPRCWTMSIEPLSKTSLRKSPPTAELEALRIGAAMEHVKAHGNLDGFPAGRGERLALMTTAGKQGLVVWSRSRRRYELTSRGFRRVRALRRAGRNALRERQGGAVRSGMNALVTAAGAVVVVGAVFLAFNPSGSTNLAPGRQPAAYFTSGAPAPAQAQAARGMQPAAEAEPRAVIAAAMPGSEQVFSEPAVGAPQEGRAASPGWGAAFGPGSAMRPSCGAPTEGRIAEPGPNAAPQPGEAARPSCGAPTAGSEKTCSEPGIAAAITALGSASAAGCIPRAACACAGAGAPLVK